MRQPNNRRDLPHAAQNTNLLQHSVPECRHHQIRETSYTTQTMITTDKDNRPLPEPGFTWCWENDEWMLRPNPPVEVALEVALTSPESSILEKLTAESGIDIKKDFQALEDDEDFEKSVREPLAKIGCRIVRLSEAEEKAERPKRQAQMLAEEIMTGADDGKSLVLPW